MRIDKAMDALEMDQNVRRESWDDKHEDENRRGAHIEMDKPDHAPRPAHRSLGDVFAFVRLRKADGTLVPFTLTQGDIRADDWVVVE